MTERERDTHTERHSEKGRDIQIERGRYNEREDRDIKRDAEREGGERVKRDREKQRETERDIER